MSDMPSSLFRHWVHSQEEDAEGVAVYRPADYPFPPARGRRGLEFAPDGTFVDHPIGRGDAPGAVAGRWDTADGRRLALTFPAHEQRPDRHIEILHCDDDVLKITA